MALCCLCLNAFAQNVPDYVPSDGLVAWYPFNGNANDESGNGNDGENEGAILHENRFFESASAYFFSESDFISLPSIAVSTSFSASFWISHVEGSTVSDAILDGGQGKFIRIVPSLVSEDWRLGYNSECIGNPTATSEFSLNSWVHGALTFDGDSLHFFQDGVKQNAMGHCASDWSFQFIGFADNGEHGFDGVIDDLGIWNRALTEEEILALYIAELPISGCTDSIACNFNEEANIEDDSCIYPLFGDDCEDGGAACGEGTIWDANIQACVVSEFCQEDLDGDGVIGINDLMQLLSSFGTMCEEPETVEFSCGDPMNYHGYDYSTVQIGEQCWFAENCRHLAAVSPPSLGFEDDSLAHAYVQGYDGASVDEAMTMENYALHGVLYNQLAAESWDICPTGWHVPSDANISQQGDFEELKLSLPANAIGTALKAGPTDVPPWDGNNSSGFKGISSGARSLYWDGEFSWLDITAFYWSQSGWSRRLDSNDENLSLMGLGPAWGLSVRCLKDTEE